MSVKTARTDYPLHDLLRERWSPRSFTDKPVETEKLRSLFEAARWAASCANEQPWHFLLALKDDPAAFEQMLACLNESNQTWAKSAWGLGLTVARLTFVRGDKLNRHAYHDVGQAWANLALQATALGLHVHPMAGFNLEKARSTYAIPEGFDPVTAFALGYLGNPDDLPAEDLRQRETAPRIRKPISEFVFSGSWGNVCPLVKG